MPFNLPPPQIELGIYSDYMSKGVAQTNGGGAVSGRVTIPFTSHFYIGAFGVNNDFNTSGQNGEVTAYMGGKFSRWSTDFDVRGVFKTYPGTISKLRSNEFDLLGTGKRNLGPWQVKGSVEYSPNQHGKGGYSVYSEGNLGYHVTPKDLISVGYGRRIVEVGHNYSGYNIGYTRDLTDRIAIDARWYNTDLNVDHYGKKYGSRAVVSLKAKF